MRRVLICVGVGVAGFYAALELASLIGGAFFRRSRVGGASAMLDADLDRPFRPVE